MNLLDDTDRVKSIITNNTVNRSVSSFHEFYLEGFTGEDVGCLSFDVSWSDDIDISNSNRIVTQGTGSHTVWSYDFQPFDLKAEITKAVTRGKTSNRVSNKTFKLSANNLTNEYLNVGISFDNCLVTFSFSKFQIAKGTKSTQWTPSISDTSTAIENAQSSANTANANFSNLDMSAANLVNYTNHAPLLKYWLPTGWSSVFPVYDAVEKALVFKAQNGWVTTYANLGITCSRVTVSFKVKRKTGTCTTIFLTNQGSYQTDLWQTTISTSWQTKTVTLNEFNSSVFGIMVYIPDNTAKFSEVYIKDLMVTTGNREVSYQKSAFDVNLDLDNAKGGVNLFNSVDYTIPTGGNYVTNVSWTETGFKFKTVSTASTSKPSIARIAKIIRSEERRVGKEC